MGDIVQKQLGSQGGHHPFHDTHVPIHGAKVSDEGGSGPSSTSGSGCTPPTDLLQKTIDATLIPRQDLGEGFVTILSRIDTQIPKG